MFICLERFNKNVVMLTDLWFMVNFFKTLSRPITFISKMLSQGMFKCPLKYIFEQDTDQRLFKPQPQTIGYLDLDLDHCTV